MNSRQQPHEIRLRGLEGVGVAASRVHVDDAARGGESVRVDGEACGGLLERMNSPLEVREVRLRGLYGSRPCAALAW
jgi:hypothetical protein